MKKFKAPGFVQDNLGNYHPAGTDLVVSDKAAAGHIDAARAGAIANMKSKGKAKSKAKAAKPRKPKTVTPPPAPIAPVVTPPGGNTAD